MVDGHQMRRPGVDNNQIGFFADLEGAEAAMAQLNQDRVDEARKTLQAIDALRRHKPGEFYFVRACAMLRADSGPEAVPKARADLENAVIRSVRALAWIERPRSFGARPGTLRRLKAAPDHAEWLARMGELSRQRFKDD